MQRLFCLAKLCEVPFSHKGRVFVMALLSVPVPDSKLCALLLFFPSWSRVPPLLAVYWLSPAGISHLIGWRAHQGAFGRFSFVYMPVEKTPKTTVTLSNQTIFSYPDRHTGVHADCAHTYTHSDSEVSRCPETGQMERLCSLRFYALCST